MLKVVGGCGGVGGDRRVFCLFVCLFRFLFVCLFCLFVVFFWLKLLLVLVLCFRSRTDDCSGFSADKADLHFRGTYPT